MLRASPQTRVDLIDRLPTPYGLVRSGVAPDHQSTKGVTRVLDRVLAKPEVAFFGGVEVGRDVSLDELRGLYDAVVIATGAALDRRLDVPGEDLPGVFSSGRFIGWYNAHPDHADIDVRAVATAVVIGSGNRIRGLGSLTRRRLVACEFRRRADPHRRSQSGRRDEILRSRTLGVRRTRARSSAARSSCRSRRYRR
jgi:NADPH-dependent glutamate synthase beta subunit-like oxidoreductase